VFDSTSEVFWTPALVGEQLVRAFRSLPNHFACCEGERVEIEGVPAHVAAPLGWPSRFVVQSGSGAPDDRVCVLTWARAMALPHHSINEFCQEFSLPQEIFERRRCRALIAIANKLNGRAPIAPGATNFACLIGPRQPSWSRWPSLPSPAKQYLRSHIREDFHGAPAP